jgi:predicted lipoprotein
MKKTIRYAIFLVTITFLAYNSVYFKKLDEVKAGTTAFDAENYAAGFWTNKLPAATLKAVEAGQLLALINTDKEKAFKEHANALGIGNIKYFLIKGVATVTEVNENKVAIQVVSAAGNPAMRIATEYIFGNAVRDASGVIDINTFSNSMDFNNVSAEINRIIREKVVPPFRSKVKKGDRIEFTGAIELNQEHLKLDNIEVIPVNLKILDR